MKRECYLLSVHLVRRTGFDTPLALFLFTAAVGVWAAYDRPAAWAKFWLMAGGVFFFYVLCNSGLRPTTLAWVPTVMGACLALYFLLTHDWSAYEVKAEILTSIGKTWQSLRPAVAAAAINPNEMGGVLAMLTPFAAWTGWHTWRNVARDPNVRRAVKWPLSVAAAGSLSLIVLGTLMSVSRGAWLALGTIAFLAGAWIMAGSLTRHCPERRRRVWAAVVVLGSVMGLLAALTLHRAQFFEGSLFRLDSVLGRLGFHRNSLLLVSDYPLIGAGLDGFQMLYSSYALLIHVGFIDHSHNLFLSVAIDQGLPGLLALVWMCGTVCIAAWRGAAAVDRQAEPSLSPALGVATLSIVVILVHGFVESALYGKFVFLLFLPLAFAALKPSQRREPVRCCVARPWLVGVATLAILALLWPSQSLSLFYANLGAIRQSQAELSVYSWPEWPLQDAVRRAVDLDPAVRAFERALTFNSTNPTANRRLGMIELSLGEYQDALEHLQHAYAAEQWSTTSRQLLGEALIVNGYQDEGEALWTDVNNEQGQFAARAFWYGYIDDAEREAAIQQAAQGK